MYIIRFNEEQYKGLFGLLDSALRSGGLSALSVVVDIHNAISLAQKESDVETLNNEKDWPEGSG